MRRFAHGYALLTARQPWIAIAAGGAWVAVCTSGLLFLKTAQEQVTSGTLHLVAAPQDGELNVLAAHNAPALLGLYHLVADVSIRQNGRSIGYEDICQKQMSAQGSRACATQSVMGLLYPQQAAMALESRFWVPNELNGTATPFADQLRGLLPAAAGLPTEVTATAELLLPGLRRGVRPGDGPTARAAVFRFPFQSAAGVAWERRARARLWQAVADGTVSGFRLGWDSEAQRREEGRHAMHRAEGALLLSLLVCRWPFYFIDICRYKGLKYKAPGARVQVAFLLYRHLQV